MLEVMKQLALERKNSSYTKNEVLVMLQNFYLGYVSAIVESNMSYTVKDYKNMFNNYQESVKFVEELYK